MRPSDLPPAEQYPHGTRARYVSGCRCSECREANRLYYHQRKRAEWNGLVSADEVRAYLRRLSKRGVGYKTVADAADVSKTVLAKVMRGDKKFLRAQSAKRILAVDHQAVADHALVSAGRTWQRLDTLIAEGFTKAELARRIGKKTPALQLNKRRILAINASRVERLWRTVMAGA